MIEQIGYSIGPTHSWLQSPIEPLSFVALGAFVLNYHRFAVMAIRLWMSNKLPLRPCMGSIGPRSSGGVVLQACNGNV